jgi:hypothetical protein
LTCVDSERGSRDIINRTRVVCEAIIAAKSDAIFQEQLRLFNEIYTDLRRIPVFYVLTPQNSYDELAIDLCNEITDLAEGGNNDEMFTKFLSALLTLNNIENYEATHDVYYNLY